MTVDADRARMARVAVHHHLAPAARTDDVAAVTRSTMGLHASDPTSPYLSAAARGRTLDVETVDAALYEDRTVVRLHGMRRTLFVVAVDDAPLLFDGCNRPRLPAERRRLEASLVAAGMASDPSEAARRLDALLDRTHAALSALGPATARAVKDAVPELALEAPLAPTRPEPTVPIAGRVLFLLAFDGRIVRGRPEGSWLSSRWRWSTTERWLGRPFPRADTIDARRSLVHRWLRAYGPGTEDDLAWWTGWSRRDLRAAYADLPLRPAEVDGRPGFAIDDGTWPTGDPAERLGAWLLPSLDPLVMGYRHRDAYVGGHTARLFDRNGNAGPTMWWDGRIVGGWGQADDGALVLHAFETLPAEAETAFARARARIERFLDGVRPTPRFRTPTERRIRARRSARRRATEEPGHDPGTGSGRRLRRRRPTGP